MAPKLEATVMDFLVRANYRNQDKSKKHIVSVLKLYPSLMPKLEPFTFADGSSKPLICLRGTIPVFFRKTTYNIPVAFWILDTYPAHAPIGYVVPTSDMLLKPSRNVDNEGKIYLPYLHEWDSNRCDMISLIQICIVVFGDMPPVFSKPRGGGPAPLGMVYPPSTPSAAATTAYRPPGAGNVGPAYPPAGYPTQAYLPQIRFPNLPSYSADAAYPVPAGGSAATVTDLEAGNTGTITQEHLKASLRSAVEDKVKRHLGEELAMKLCEIQSLSKMKEDLQQGQGLLQTAVHSLDRELSELEAVCCSIQEETKTLDDKLSQIEDSEQDGNPDDAITASAPLYKQLVNCYAEEAALEDAIYYLGEALRQGVIDCGQFLKQVRKLSRKQFFLRATMNKCRQTAGLAC